MAYQSFEDLEVWQRGCRFSVEIFQAFEKCRLTNLKNQIERAGLSVPSNIAEGAERGGKKEFSQFLKIAKGSSGEVRTQLYIAGKLQAIEVESVKRLVKESKEISAMIEGLRKSVMRETTKQQPKTYKLNS
jgi:four helix bundle protein